MKSLHNCVYPELAFVLREFAAGVRAALGSNFLGAYLVGSLATGDFDLESDVDFLVVTKVELCDAEVKSLAAARRYIHALGSYPAEHLEGSYVSAELLARPDTVGVQPIWYLDNGSTSLERSVHDNRWHVRWILRERGITITGPTLPAGASQPPQPALAAHPVRSARASHAANRFTRPDLTLPRVSSSVKLPALCPLQERATVGRGRLRFHS
jgi:hypothetical protein